MISARARALNATIAGIVPGSTANRDPKRIVTVAPVVLLMVVPRYSSSAAMPRLAPSTMPVARSRPRGRWMPISSMTAAAPTADARKPHSAPTPARKAADPPAAPMSDSASPANACPRMTANTPTAPDTIAAVAPTASAVWTDALSKNPWPNTVASSRLTRLPRPLSGQHLDGVLGLSLRAPIGGTEDNEDPAMDAQHVDVVPLQAAEHLAAHALGGGTAGGPAPG